jgi:hypothetical protein
VISSYGAAKISDARLRLFASPGVKRMVRADSIEAARHAGAESSYSTAEGGESKPVFL